MLKADIALTEAKIWAMAIAVWIVIVLVVLAAIAWPGLYLLHKIANGLAHLNWVAASPAGMMLLVFLVGIVIGLLINRPRQ